MKFLLVLVFRLRFRRPLQYCIFQTLLSISFFFVYTSRMVASILYSNEYCPRRILCVLYCIFICLFKDNVSFSPNWLWIHSLAENNFDNLPTFTSKILAWMVCATSPLVCKSTFNFNNLLANSFFSFYLTISRWVLFIYMIIVTKYNCVYLLIS